jgi:hypothetical protein
MLIWPVMKGNQCCLHESRVVYEEEKQNENKRAFYVYTFLVQLDCGGCPKNCGDSTHLWVDLTDPWKSLLACLDFLQAAPELSLCASYCSPIMCNITPADL